MRYGSIGRTTVFKIEAKSQSFAVFIILLICLSKDAAAGRGTGVGTGVEFGDGGAAGSLVNLSSSSAGINGLSLLIWFITSSA
ncbi:MAG: hypothetical protein M3R11_05780 [Acidobacteriota bacterium]|nr:hypothetical protein [Acidobacteriota bacterium]